MLVRFPDFNYNNSGKSKLIERKQNKEMKIAEEFYWVCLWIENVQHLSSPLSPALAAFNSQY